MRFVQKNKLLFVFLFIVVLLCLHAIARNMLHLKNVTVVAESPLSLEIQLTIEAWLNDAIKRYSRYYACQKLKEKFPCIKHMCLQQKYPGRCCLLVKPLNPLCAINDTHLLLENGTVVEKNYFIEQVTSNITSIKVSTFSECDFAHFFTWFKQVPEKILSQYTITWNDKTHITFVDKQLPNTMLVAHHESLLSENILEKANQIMRTTAESTADVITIIDLRFNDQILCYKKRGYHETHRVFS